MPSFSIPPISLPEDWFLTHLIFLDPEWQVNLSDPHYAVVATGDSPEDAILAAVEKIYREDWVGFHIFKGVFKHTSKPKLEFGLLAHLGLETPKQPIKRRKL